MHFYICTAAMQRFTLDPVCNVKQKSSQYSVRPVNDIGAYCMFSLHKSTVYKKKLSSLTCFFRCLKVISKRKSWFGSECSEAWVVREVYNHPVSQEFVTQHNDITIRAWLDCLGANTDIGKNSDIDISAGMPYVCVFELSWKGGNYEVLLFSEGVIPSSYNILFLWNTCLPNWVNTISIYFCIIFLQVISFMVLTLTVLLVFSCASQKPF